MKSQLFLLIVYCWNASNQANACTDVCLSYDMTAARLCKNNGFCKIDPSTCGFTCVCQPNFGGQFCEKRLQCAPNVCNVNEDCIVKDNQAICVCKPGRIGNPVAGCDVKVRKACLYGDPHYTTFDGFNFNYHGTCPVVLTQNRDKIEGFPDFKISTTNRLMPTPSKLSFASHMEMELYGQRLNFRDKQFFFNDVLTSVPFNWPNEQDPQIRVTFNGVTFLLHTQHNIEVLYETGYACIYMPDIPILRGEKTLVGLFGNIDYSWVNDMICKDGSKIIAEANTHDVFYNYSEPFVKCQDSHITTFGNTTVGCVTGMTLLHKKDDCDVNSHAKFCEPIIKANTKEGGFAACSVLGESALVQEQQDCVVEMCSGPTYKCSAFTAFASRCSKALPAGVSIGAWRDALECPMECGPNSQHKYCSSACPRTCANLDYQETCTENCLEKCECLPGFVVDNTETSFVKCIRVEECGCQGPQGKWHPASQNFLNDQCNHYSGCYGGQYVSKSIECSNDAACSIKDGIRQCVCNPGFVGDGFTCGIPQPSAKQVIALAPQCNICASYPCLNGGNCTADVTDQCTKYTCACALNYVGDKCERKIECLEDSCAKDAECKIENSKTVCTCKGGYGGDAYELGCFPYVRRCLIGNRYNTMNSFSTQFYGTCPVLMFRTKEKPQNHENFEIIVRKHGVSDASTVTSIKEVEITIANQTILIENQKRIYLNGSQITTPFYYPNEKDAKFYIDVTQWSVVLKGTQSYAVEFGETSGLCVSIPKDPDFDGTTIFEGIGGNIGTDSGIICRDGKFVSPPATEQDEINVVECIDSWIEPMKTRFMNEKCVNGHTIFGNSKISECTTAIAHADCSVIRDASEGQGVFANCSILNKGTITQFHEDCSLGMCLKPTSKCDILAAFVAACANKLHHSLGNWHTTVGCPVKSCNEPNTEYKECASQCQDTCAQRNRDTCTKGCREGCVCKPGFIIDNTVTDRLVCIHESDCGCADQDGKWYHANSEWLSNQCRSINKCQNGMVTSKRNECGENAECGKNENGSPSCKCIDGYKGDGYVCVSIEEPKTTRATRVPNPKPDPCVELPCQNGGTCETIHEGGIVDFRCKCPKTHGGTLCDDLIECGDITCGENGFCDHYGPACKCKKGYRGDGLNCTKVDEHKTIQEEATLAPKQGEHDICASEPCKNDGVCIRDKDDPGNKFACKCPANFGGSLCDDLLECTEDTCGENAKCTVMNNKVDCVCKKGYAGNPFKTCGKIRTACVAQDPHIKTFDGLEVDYHGTCPYLFTSSCGKSVDKHTPFQAVLKNHLSDGEGERYLSWVYEAEVELFNQTIHMDMYSEELIVNQVKQNPPFYWPNQENPKITILFRARTYSIKTNDGIEFTFGNYKFCANLPEVAGFKNPSSLCGIAGNIDDKWENDVVWRNGSILELDKQDYKFDFSYPELQKCQDTWITTMKTIKRDHKKCQTAETLGRLYMNSSCNVEVPTKLCLPIKQAQSKSGPFAMCSVMGDHAIEGLYQDCIVETCPNITHLCREFKVMASACRDALPQDTDMGDWRKETECPLECPANSVYSTCKSACPETCAENGKPTCDKGCVEGCQCNPGYVLDNTVSEVVKCIKKTECGCTDQRGNWHRAGRTFLTNNCEFISQCENGSLIEKSHECGRNAECVTADSLMRCNCKYGFAGNGYTCSEVTKTEGKLGVPVTCYPGWKYCKITNKCYRNFAETLVSFEEGKRVCAKHSAEPVSINIKEELNFLAEVFGTDLSGEKSSAWVGLQCQKGSWDWMDGTKAQTKWSTDANHKNNCAMLSVASDVFDLVDVDCNFKAAGVICEGFPIMSTVCET